MLILSQSDVERLLPMNVCIVLMERALTSLAQGETILPLRTVVRLSDGHNAFAVMPAVITSPMTIGAKVITVFPGNRGTALDSHQGAVLLFDPANGQLAAVINATAITTTRTAAVSALATRVLARADATRLVIIGAGVQAHAHLDAIRQVRTITSLRVVSRNAENAAKLAERARAHYGIADAAASTTAADAVREADIVCTTTSSTTPVLHGDWLAPGTHVNAIGACTPNARELDSAAVVRSRLYVDRRESALAEPGDIVTPLHDGEIGPEHVVAELGELLIGRGEGRRNAQDITLFKSLGLAIEDLAAAWFVMTEGAAIHAGTSIDFGGVRHVTA